MPKVFTLGTSDRPFEEFLGLLRLYQIQAVADVRKFPTSRWEHFKKETFRSLLEAGEIDYFYLGKELGGFRSGGYQAYMKTEEFRKGIERLKEIAFQMTTVIVCAERFPWRCHRRFISKFLEFYSFQVVHIIDKDKVCIKKKVE